MTAVTFIVVFLIITVLLLIRAELLSIKAQIYFWKPLSTLLVISIVLFGMFSENRMSQAYSLWILWALLFSMGGDIALMFQENQQIFRLGLNLFLIAHVIYSICFYHFAGDIETPVGLLLFLVVIAAVGYAWFYPNLGNMKISVLIYVLIINYMLFRAILTRSSRNFSGRQTWLIGIGAMLFYISDFMLAINRFRWPFKYHRVSLAFYYAGQACLALSTIMIS